MAAFAAVLLFQLAASPSGGGARVSAKPFFFWQIALKKGSFTLSTALTDVFYCLSLSFAVGFCVLPI
ncbi:hypothetical protein CCACVL1_03211 [Corchorus capsularis]|uniref:Uncharacterized protein n=1 Tax=Corchorus capsularis TaxID=210143 RepID=A0A1R3K1P5_COCAP|nr:hypothetical protein CCACVL1_03211 [Corchorus capsularis]